MKSWLFFSCCVKCSHKLVRLDLSDRLQIRWHRMEACWCLYRSNNRPSSLWYERTSSFRRCDHATSHREPEVTVSAPWRLCVCFYFGIKDWLPLWQGMGVSDRRPCVFCLYFCLRGCYWLESSLLYLPECPGACSVCFPLYSLHRVPVWGWCMQHMCMFYVLLWHVCATCV